MCHIAQVQPNDPGLCLVQNIRQIDLESHRKPELLCGRDGGLCRICPVLARTRHAPGCQQLFALGLRECRTPQAKRLGDGLILRRRARRGRGKAIGQAMLAPCMVGEAALQASGQFVRRVEDRYPGSFELCQASLRVPASGPQEHHTLVGPITLADDLLSLGVRPGARHDERPHPRIVDHMLHDLREGLAVGKAGHIGRVRRPAEALQDPVDAVTRLLAQRRQIETGLAAHVGGQRADAARVGHHRDAGHAGLGVWASRCAVSRSSS